MIVLLVTKSWTLLILSNPLSKSSNSCFFYIGKKPVVICFSLHGGGSWICLLYSGGLWNRSKSASIERSMASFNEGRFGFSVFWGFYACCYSFYIAGVGADY
jgi:hypothetical protein